MTRWSGPVPLAVRGGVLLTGDQAGDADRDAVARGGTWDGLLATAGAGLARAVLDVLRERTGGAYGRRVTVVVGKGDNGGDGWVAARHLRARGVDVEVLATHGLEVAMSDHSAAARAAWLDDRGRARAFDDDAWWRRSRRVRHDVVVDCVLGTGAHGAPRDEAAPAVAAIAGVHAGGPTVVACDVPSGVDADDGSVADHDRAVVADLTVTFGAAKRGLVLDPGSRHAGEVRVVALGDRWWPRVSAAGHRDAQHWTAIGRVLAAPRALPVDADKRSRGRVAVLAGSRRYGGAPVLTATAALRTGAGLVTVATSADPVPVLATDPGLMVRGLRPAQDEVGGPHAADVATVLEVVADADVVVVGPGLGHEDDTRTVVDAVLDSATGDHPRVIVLDADGLNVLRADAAALATSRHLLVLTPHGRELARLLDEDVEDTAGGRQRQAARLAAVAGAVVIAKGPTTVVVGPDGRTAVTTSGGPGLGTGGSGDVLAGIVGAVLAGRRPTTSDEVHGGAARAVQFHGHVGEHAAARAGERATAAALLTSIPAVLGGLAAERPDRAAGW